MKKKKKKRHGQGIERMFLSQDNLNQTITLTLIMVLLLACQELRGAPQSFMLL